MKLKQRDILSCAKPAFMLAVILCAAYRPARGGCEETFGEVKNGAEFVRRMGQYWYSGDSPQARNDALEHAVNNALSAAIVGKLQERLKIENSVLAEHFIQIQREGFVKSYKLAGEPEFKSTGSGMLASVCVEAEVRQVAFDLTESLVKNPPGFVLAVVTGTASRETGVDTLNTMRAKLKEKYGSGIRLPADEAPDAGFYKSTAEAVSANTGKADFLVALDGLDTDEIPGKIKSLEIRIGNLKFYEPELGPAGEFPFSVPSVSAYHSGTSRAVVYDKALNNAAARCVEEIDRFMLRIMSDSAKIVAFTGKIPFEQFSDFSRQLSETVKGVNSGFWGEPKITPLQDKNYFRVDWKGTAFELAQAIDRQLAGDGRKFQIKQVNFRTVVLEAAQPEIKTEAK
ncbi:MAG: hypothetical protein WC421_07750 [Elusimicrobiales bacterium]